MNLMNTTLMARKGQVWIEVVIYTLISLSIMAILLGIIKPAIDERKDAIAVRQSIDLLNDIDKRINDIKYVPANSRNLELKIARGKLGIDGQNDAISIIIEDSKYAPSEPGLIVSEGNIKELTNSSNNKLYLVSLTLDYKDKLLNITYKGKDELKIFQHAPTPYNLVVRNNGGKDLTNIDFF